MFENMKRFIVFFALFAFSISIQAEDKRVYSENDFINIFSGKTPVNSSGSGNSSGSNTDGDNPDSSTGIPSYVWWIVGGLALLGAIWAGIHFSKQA